MPDVFAKVPMIVVVVPAILLLLDVGYKALAHGKLPSDSMSDIALAALTFTAVHLFLAVTSPQKNVGIGVWPLLILFAQWAFWTTCSLLGKKMEQLDDFGRVGSYFLGILWFTYTTAGILASMP